MSTNPPAAGGTIGDNFDTQGAAEYLTLKKPTLDCWRVTGRGPKFCKIGSRVVYRRVDLDAWLESKLVSSTSETA